METKTINCKTLATNFYIRNHPAPYKFQVKIPTGDILKFEPKSKCFGIKLARNLTFKNHLADLQNKVATRVVLIKRLASLTSGASFQILQTSSLALVFSTAEYCVPALVSKCSHQHG